MRRATSARRTRGMDVGTTLKYDVVIIGAGPAGMCAGMYAGRAMLKTVVLERIEPGGELLNTEIIEDYPGFEHILGRDLAVKFADHAAKFGAEFKNGVVVESVHKRDDGIFVTRTDSGDVFLSPAVILTAGGTPVKLGIQVRSSTPARACRIAPSATARSSVGRSSPSSAAVMRRRRKRISSRDTPRRCISFTGAMSCVRRRFSRSDCSRIRRSRSSGTRRSRKSWATS